MTIYTSPYESVELVSQSIYTAVLPPVETKPDAPAFIDAETGYTITRSQLRDLALTFGYGLTHYNAQPPSGLLSRLVLTRPTHRGLPLRAGQILLVFMPNCLAYTFTYFGAIAAGIKVTLANASYTPRELAYQIKNSDADAVLVHPVLYPVLEKSWKELGVGPDEARRRTVIADWKSGKQSEDGKFKEWIRLSNLLNMGKLRKEVSFNGSRGNQTAIICYSSGTTGVAKGVETTHRNLTSLIRMFTPVFSLSKEGDVALGFLPFYHIFAAVKILLFFPYHHIPVVIMANYTPDTFCAYIAKYRITISLVVPPVVLALAKHPSTEKHDLTSLKRLFSGAAPLSGSLVKEVTTRLRKLGATVALSQGYGLTETSPTVTFLNEQFVDRKTSSCGLLLPHLEARLVDDEGRDVPEGQPGELWVRGPTIMRGYLNNPAATKATITSDGWLKTGDVAQRDNEGFFYIVDRKKELIKYKGFQVPPADLEAVLLTHPDVVDAAVIGVYSLQQGTELPRAYVVPRAGMASFKSPGDQATFEREVQTWIQKKVAKHKYLRGGVVAIDAIPKSAAGKILRRDLRELVKRTTGIDPITGEPVQRPVKAKL